jgi:hypothetical protein
MHWLVTFNYRIGDIYVFYITGYVLLAILAAVGIDLIGKILLRFVPKWGQLLQAVFSLLIILFVTRNMLLPWLPAIKESQVPFIGEEGYVLWEDPSQMYREASMTVAKMKPDSVFFVDWGWLYMYYYAAQIDADRLDLRFIEAAPRSDVPGLPISVIEFVEENIDSRPIYFSSPIPEIEQAGFDFQRREIWSRTFYEVVNP